VLGYAGAKRAAMTPELPTIAEAGVPGFEVMSWCGLFVPAKTPPEIVKKMNTDAVAALADPSVSGRLDQLGYTVASSTPEELAAFLRADVDRWGRVIKDSGIVLQN